VAIVAKPQLRKPSAVAERRTGAVKRATAASPAATPPRRPSFRPSLPVGAAVRVGAHTQGLTTWAHQVWGELRKCVWPTREQTTKLTTVIIAISIAVGIFLGGVDALFAALITAFLR
jgi:preprotein translocase SecE subunit